MKANIYSYKGFEIWSYKSQTDKQNLPVQITTILEITIFL